MSSRVVATVCAGMVVVACAASSVSQPSTVSGDRALREAGSSTSPEDPVVSGGHTTRRECVIAVTVDGRVSALDLCYRDAETVVSEPYYSPDGRRIAFTRAALGATGRTGRSQLLLYHAVTGVVTVFYDPRLRSPAEGGPTEWQDPHVVARRPIPRDC